MNSRILKTTLLAGLATLATIGATTSNAAGAVVTQSVAVNYSDLDLTSSAGNAALYRRLRAAALEVCGEPDVRDLRASAAARACYVKAMQQAVQRIDRAPLTALHALHATRSAG